MTLAPAAYLTLRSPNFYLAVTRPAIPAPSRVNIVPKLGQHRITDVTPSDLQSLGNEWSTRLAPRTVSRAYGVARALFAHGVACDLISRSHCRGAKLPRVDVTSRRAPRRSRSHDWRVRGSVGTGRWSTSGPSSVSGSRKSLSPAGPARLLGALDLRSRNDHSRCSGQPCLRATQANRVAPDCRPAGDGRRSAHRARTRATPGP